MWFIHLTHLHTAESTLGVFDFTQAAQLGRSLSLCDPRSPTDFAFQFKLTKKKNSGNEESFFFVSVTLRDAIETLIWIKVHAPA